MSLCDLNATTDAMYLEYIFRLLLPLPHMKSSTISGILRMWGWGNLETAGWRPISVHTNDTIQFDPLIIASLSATKRHRTEMRMGHAWRYENSIRGVPLAVSYA